jgi:hypothetical protein
MSIDWSLVLACVIGMIPPICVIVSCLRDTERSIAERKQNDD